MTVCLSLSASVTTNMSQSGMQAASLVQGSMSTWVGSTTTGPNALVISAIAGMVVLLFGVIALIIWFARTEGNGT
jgi:hypothetical protein